MKFEYFSILLFLTFSNINEAITVCPTYVCDEKLKEGVCMEPQYKSIEASETNTAQEYTEYHLKHCKDDLGCEFTGEYGYCRTLEAEQTLKADKENSRKLPGNFCERNSDCISNECLIDRCIGKYSGNYCEDHSDCDLGLRCTEDNLCEFQIPDGKEGCEDDFDCVNTAGCHDNTCINYFTLANGSESSSKMLCKSGYLFNGKCSNGPQIIGRQFPYKCDINATYTEKCVYRNSDGEVFTLDCQCGVNEQGQGFCPLLENDEKYSNYLFYLRKYMKNHCHTLARAHPDKCDALDPYSYNYIRLRVNLFEYYNNHILQDNQVCMKETVLYDFYHQITAGSVSNPRIALLIILLFALY